MATPDGADPQPQAGGVVVGVDGSPGSLAALRWAVAEASERGQTVQAVTAWHFPMPSPVGNVPGRRHHPRRPYGRPQGPVRAAMTRSSRCS
ncbi:MAG: universal stress protein [Pseudonocardia sp.]|nr:universal stress protein [Pseudonocardia sp.]